MNLSGERTSGPIAAITAYLVWGFMPLYFLAVDPRVSMWEIFLHRVIWAAVLLLLFTVSTRRTARLTAVLTRPRRLAALAASAAVIAVNWEVFIWAVTHNQVLPSSIGYFISPLISVLLGFVFLREQLLPLQFLAVGIATLGVLIMVVAANQPPWVALTLATAFGVYGLIRKQVPIDSITGLLVETLLLLPLALAWLSWLYLQHRAAFLCLDRPTDLLLIGAGALTICPLVLFAFAARRLRLGTVGLIMYIAPTTQLLISVLLLGEPFSKIHKITFGHIWVGLAIFSFDSFLAPRQPCRQPADAPQG